MRAWCRIRAYRKRPVDTARNDGTHRNVITYQRPHRTRIVNAQVAHDVDLTSRLDRDMIRRQSTAHWILNGVTQA